MPEWAFIRYIGGLCGATGMLLGSGLVLGWLMRQGRRPRRAPNNPGKAMAKLTLSYGAAQMLAPVVAGYMAQTTGTFKGALWLTAVVMAAGMGLLATLPKDDSKQSTPRTI
jgi:MFS family permease